MRGRKPNLTAAETFGLAVAFIALVVAVLSMRVAAAAGVAAVWAFVCWRSLRAEAEVRLWMLRR